MKEYDSSPSYDMSVYRQVGMLHIDGINKGFLATLGLPFLTLLYEAIDKSPSSVLLVEQQGSRVIGYVSGGIGMKPIYRKLLSRFTSLMWALIPSLLRPKKLKRIVEILRYSGSTSQEGADLLPRFELLSIVVAAESRGTGCAEKLYKRLMLHCESRGIDSFKIIVGDALLPAHRFYQRMGAVQSGRIEVHKGEDSVVYIQKIPRME